MSSTTTEAQSLEDILTEIGFGRFQICTIAILGFLMFCDSSETLMLAFIGPILICDWRISMPDLTVLTTSVFMSTVVGSCIFGKLSDMYGRRTILLVTIVGIIYFSILSTVTPTISWFITFRTVLGIFVGGSGSLLSVYCAEVMPMKHRATGLLLFWIFYGFGPFVHGFLVMFVVPKFGWRVWLFLTALPIFAVIPGLIWLPESPRQLLTQNRVEEALESLRKIAAVNRRQITTEIQIPEPTNANLLDIFHRKYLLTTVLMFYLWFLFGFSYFGFLQTAVINNIPHKCLQNPTKTSIMAPKINGSFDTSCCYRQTSSNFRIILIANAGETCMSIGTVIVGSYFKRKHYMFFLVFINMAVFFLINLCLSPLQLGLLLLFGRGSSSSLFGMNSLYNSEVYPTSIRGYAVGFGSGFSRIGAISAQISFGFLMIGVSFLGGSLLFCSLNLVGLICIIFLPYETKDMKLRQGVEDEIECNNPIYKKKWS